MEADPADSVKELLEQADGPMSTSEIAKALGEYPEHVIEQSLDFWRREHHAVTQDHDGNWVWHGTELD